MLKKAGKKACIFISAMFIVSSIGVQFSFAEQSNTVMEGISNQPASKWESKELKKGKCFPAYIKHLRYATYDCFKVKSPEHASAYKISGYIKPDLDSPDQQIKSGFNVSIVGLSGYSTYTNMYGYFEIQGVPSNTEGYTIAISKEQYLYREIKNVSVTTQDVQIGSQTVPVDMWAGDITNDNSIDMLDQAEIKKRNFSVQGAPNFEPICDLNKDGKINMADTIIIGRHFEATPESYPNLF
jgi:hypothetical protein